jgi:hypothetical protein
MWGEEDSDVRESLAEQIKLPNQWSEKKGGPGEL